MEIVQNPWKFFKIHGNVGNVSKSMKILQSDP